MPQLLLWALAGCGRAPERPDPHRPPSTTPSVPSAAVARLSHAEWENAVQDVLGLPAPTGLARNFLVDARATGFDNDAAHLSIDPVLWAQYGAAAAALGDRVVAEPDLRARVTGGDPPEVWIPRFAALVYRHPLSDEEAAACLAAYDDGAATPPGGPDEGLRQVVTFLFQSPWFLYRLERTGVGGAPVGALDGWDVASRLSFALWNTVPDEALRAAAADGSLLTDAGFSTQLDRMLASPRARAAVIDLHRQLLVTDAYANISPSAVVAPSFDEDTVDAMRTEVDGFVEHVVFEDGTLRDLLRRSRRTFVTPELAAIYGVSGVPAGARSFPVDLDPAQRGGLTTLAGFLAMTATATSDHPILRSVAIHHAWTCVNLPAPPPGATPVPPATEVMTTRERFDAHTGEGTCGEACHATMINPIGFAYGHYGAVGEWRDTELGLPIDAAAAYTFSTGRAEFDGALEFLDLLVEQPDVHECYARHLFAYVYGRHPDAADEAVVQAVGHRSFAEDRPIRELLADLARDPRFVDR